MRERARLSDEIWFEKYGPSIGAAAVAVADPERVRAFNRAVAELETRAGKPLGEPGRGRCFAAFCESPDGFRRLVHEAGKRGTTNVLGLLVVMVAAREHRSVVDGESPGAEMMRDPEQRRRADVLRLSEAVDD